MRGMTDGYGGLKKSATAVDSFHTISLVNENYSDSLLKESAKIGRCFRSQQYNCMGSHFSDRLLDTFTARSV